MTILTIGHSNHQTEAFRALLDRHGVQALADVRSSPFSRRFPQFSHDSLRALLEAAGIRYVFKGDQLGGRSDRASDYDANGAELDERMVPRPELREGIERLRDGFRRLRIVLLD